MALTKLTTDLNIIAALDDEPNDVGGLSAAQLKAKFDEGANDVKTYINDVHIVEIDAHIANISNPHTVTKAQVGLGNCDNTSDANKPVSTAQQTALNLKADKSNVLEKNNTTSFTPSANYHPATKKYVDDVGASVVLGQIPDGTITEAKLADNAVTTSKLSNSSVTSDKLSNDLNTTINVKLDKSGGTMTGDLNLNGAPTQDSHAATKAYVDGSGKFVKLFESTVGTAAQSISLSLSGIDTTQYSEIIVYGEAKTDAGNISCTVNNITSGYYGTYLRGSTTSVSALNGNPFIVDFATDGRVVPIELKLQSTSEYLTTRQLKIVFSCGKNTSDVFGHATIELGTGALTSVQINAYSGQKILVGSKFYVYGVKK